jgi:hypothetical protein
MKASADFAEKLPLTAYFMKKGFNAKILKDGRRGWLEAINALSE